MDISAGLWIGPRALLSYNSQILIAAAMEPTLETPALK